MSQHPALAPSRALVVLALCAAVALVVGCSDDDSDSEGQRHGDADARHEDAGRVDGGGRDAAAMDGGGDRPFDGTCGGRTCSEPPLLTPLCCTVAGAGRRGDPLENTGRAPDLCGTDVGMYFAALEGICVQLEQPGTVDDECPAQEQLGGGVVMPGCCTDEGYCGSLENLIGFGCFYATGRKGRPCTPGSDADAGI